MKTAYAVVAGAGIALNAAVHGLPGLLGSLLLVGILTFTFVHFDL